jgi:hypothetical protein
MRHFAADDRRGAMSEIAKAGAVVVPATLIDQLKDMAKRGDVGAGSAPQQIPTPTPRPSPGPVITT